MHSSKKFESPVCMFPAEVKQGNALPHTVSKCPFCGLCSATLSIFVFFLRDFSEIVHSAEVMSNAPKYKKAVMCLMEKIHVLGKLLLGMGYSEFSVNESTVYIK